MRRLLIGLLAFVLACPVFAAEPPKARAQEQGVEIPALAPLQTVRFRFVLTFNGRPLRVCQGEYESWVRFHSACNGLATVPELELDASEVSENICYDGACYERFGDDPTWMPYADEEYNPNDIPSLDEALFSLVALQPAVTSRIGTTTLSGVSATQYQVWSLDEQQNGDAGGQLVYDIFLSPQNVVLKDQVSNRGTIVGLGEGELALIWEYYDHNVPITVYPPPANLIKAGSDMGEGHFARN